MRRRADRPSLVAGVALIAFGGAGPMHAAALAEALGSYAGAFGLLAAGVVSAAMLAWQTGRRLPGAPVTDGE